MQTIGIWNRYTILFTFHKSGKSVKTIFSKYSFNNIQNTLNLFIGRNNQDVH